MIWEHRHLTAYTCRYEAMLRLQQVRGKEKQLGVYVKYRALE